MSSIVNTSKHLYLKLMVICINDNNNIIIEYIFGSNNFITQ